MRPPRSAAIPALLLVAAACRHVTPAAPLPADWQVLVRAPQPFAALYRFSCCGRRDLVLTVRGDGHALALGVTVPPGGIALAAWVEQDGGWVWRAKETCREPLPKGVLPLSATASLPLDPGMASLLLSGLLPDGAHETAGQQGWVEAAGGAFWWRARVEGPEPHWTRVVIGRVGEAGAVLVADRRDAGGALPHTLALKAGSIKADLVLREWRPSDPPSPPPWASGPACEAGS